MFHRDSGILLHPTSLPGHWGIGEIGPDAIRWLDVLREMRQGLWQVLPLGPTGFGDSPYQSPSTFAGNPLLLSIDWLRDEGFVDAGVLDRFPKLPAERVDFGAVIPARLSILRAAASEFLARGSSDAQAAFQRFCTAQAGWLDDYALFAALKDAQGGRPWTEWPDPLRDRRPRALRQAASSLASAVAVTKVLQYWFDSHWNRVRVAARDRGIRLIGDIPIFVAHDSADVWAHRDLFFLDRDGMPTVVAGVPPDYFSATGQRWGNPLYDWEAHCADAFAWWTSRLRRVLSWVDILRIDHFRGFAGYWEIPAEEPTAVRGRWVDGPGESLFLALRAQLGSLPIIAEDLGLITPDVIALRDRFDLPGLRILQFAFGSDDQHDTFLPANYVRNCVAYSGTHDNDTTLGWFASEPGESSTRTSEQIATERANALRYFGTAGDEIEWDFIRALWRSRAGAVLVPLQDVLGLGSEARMNVPGCGEGNWHWRFQWSQLTHEIGQRLGRETAASWRNARGAA